MSFPAGTMITIIRGPDKAIEDIVVGDLIEGFDTTGDTVVGINVVELAGRPLYRINTPVAQVDTTGAGLFWTKLGWGCIEPDFYHKGVGEKIEYIIDGTGTKETEFYHGVREKIIAPFGPRLPILLSVVRFPRWIFAKDITDITPRDPTTLVYGLKTTNTHAMRANSFLVSASARDDDYRYPYPKNPPGLESRQK